MEKINLKTELDYVAEIEIIKKILDKQRYPVEDEKFLDSIAGEVSDIGWKYAVAKAYCFGVMRGKQKERLQKCMKK